MNSKRSHEGHFLMDHRVGPGLTLADVAASGGIPVRAGTVFESATITCSHCCRVVILNPDRERSRGYCPKCDHYVCDECEAARVAAGGICVTFQEYADTVAERSVRTSAPPPNLPLILAAKG